MNKHNNSLLTLTLNIKPIYKKNKKMWCGQNYIGRLHFFRGQVDCF